MPSNPVRFRLTELLAAHTPEPMTQAELASRSGVSPTIVNRIARNHARQVSLATLGKLAAVLGCEPGDIIASEKLKRGKR